MRLMPILAAVSISLASIQPLALAQSGGAGGAGAGSLSSRAPAEVRIYEVSDLPEGVDIPDLVHLFGAESREISPTLLGVIASAEGHDQITAAFNQLRTMADSDRLLVTVSVQPVDAGSALQVGDVAGPDVMSVPPLRRVQIATMRRNGAEIRSIESVSYIRDLTPIVGNNAVASDPEIGSAQSGLEISLILGEDTGRGTPVRFAGEFSDSTLEPPTPAPAGVTSGVVGGGPFEIQNVRSSMRSVQGNLLAPDGQPIVAAIFDDVREEGGMLALVMRVTPMRK